MLAIEYVRGNTFTYSIDNVLIYPEDVFIQSKVGKPFNGTSEKC